MAKLDSAKEEIGWLKVVFAVLAALDASLIAWVAQADEAASVIWVTMACAAIVALTAGVIWINRSAYSTIREPGGL